jgi:1-acyl-sn-glycerol-3-phosphate acyltransferase
MAAQQRRRAPAREGTRRNGAGGGARGGRQRAAARDRSRGASARGGRASARNGASAGGAAQSSSSGGDSPGGLAGLVSRRANRWSLDSVDPGFVHAQRHLWNLLQDHYFRMDTEGWHRLPDPPALIVGVHAAGIFPVDAWMFGMQWFRRFGDERLVHGTAHAALMAAPVVGDYFRRMGVVSASPETVSAALEAGRDVIVYPGGDVDSLRPWWERDKVKLAGRRGFVKQAIRSGVPIVPLATSGGMDTMFTLTEGRGLARALGLKRFARAEALPIALGVPWGIAPGVLPFLPLPAKIRTELLEPVFLDDDPERADDDAYVDRMYREVEGRLQAGVSELASRRSFPILG